MPRDVDYRIMATFVEFYTTLLGFVNYRLYSSMNLKYPPQVKIIYCWHASYIGLIILPDCRVGPIARC